MEASRVETYDVDIVIMCTGFKNDFAWLKGVTIGWNYRNWFNNYTPLATRTNLRTSVGLDPTKEESLLVLKCSAVTMVKFVRARNRCPVTGREKPKLTEKVAE